MIVSKLAVEVSKDIENLEKLFKLSPKKTEVAINRTMRKLGKWSEVQVLRIMSRELQITQKRLKEYGRIRTYLSGGYHDSKYLTVWIGTIPMGESLILTVFSGFALQGIPHSNKFRLAL